MRWLALVLTLPVSIAHAGVCQKSLVGPPSPLELARQIRKQGALNVTIDRRQINRVATALAKAKFEFARPAYDRAPFPPAELSFDETCTWFLAFDAVNYLFRDWDTGRTFDDGTLVGEDLLADRMTARLDVFGAAEQIQNLAGPRLWSIFNAVNPLPELARRHAHLTAVGEFLARLPKRGWKTWLRKFPTALDLARELGRSVAGFNDPFLARAQKFVGHLHGRLGKALPKGLRNLEGLAIASDDVVPSVLARMGILVYSDQLTTRIERGSAIPASSHLEREVRAATIVAADELLGKLRQKPAFRNLTIFDLNHGLVQQTRETPERAMPAKVYRHAQFQRHATTTTNY